uniref:RNA POLYMERASE II PRE-INITIATION COMPLEX, TOA1 n=1 Tax=Saccharomyces cerevisiae TaxID=4932 RepID=UPI000718ABAB|nr:Chain M, RNA POLYMERASE II PRE-INITIATION COMPLEX, TOA1 [Saccharomyces cerevisiae]
SNAEASRVYEIIVESVVNEVREDFENAGIDEQTLQDLKNIWQKKLTETKVTTFSWDNQFNDYLISEDGPDENLMLCLYDKVTRTKARWKCSLKDGVVTINRNDYTFQKAQVEAEWV